MAKSSARIVSDAVVSIAAIEPIPEILIMQIATTSLVRSPSSKTFKRLELLSYKGRRKARDYDFLMFSSCDLAISSVPSAEQLSIIIYSISR